MLRLVLRLVLLRLVLLQLVLLLVLQLVLLLLVLMHLQLLTPPTNKVFMSLPKALRILCWPISRLLLLRQNVTARLSRLR